MRGWTAARVPCWCGCSAALQACTSALIAPAPAKPCSVSAPSPCYSTWHCSSPLLLPPPPPLLQVCASYRRRRARLQAEANGEVETASAAPRVIHLDEVELTAQDSTPSTLASVPSAKAVIMMPDGEQLAYAVRVDSDVNLERPGSAQSPGQQQGQQQGAGQAGGDEKPDTAVMSGGAVAAGQQQGGAGRMWHWLRERRM